MAFDKPTRNRLAKFVADARGVIADEYTEQFQSLYGISAKGDIAPLDKLSHLDEAGTVTAALLRERIGYLERTHPDDKDGTKAAVARLAREQAFTILNRLAAIRMAEMRGLIVESVGKGYQSKGFKVFETVAGSALGDTYHRYRRYLFCLFDELAIDLGVLFDRRSPHALLFPREPALLALLDLLHAADLERIWAEDETIGWIYQYYNDPEERKKMRKESAAPRNSRELAVRNQFFTPRYVVEFLTDNTLGRIWYEMTKGETRLAEQCRYLVRRPTEIFLAEGDETVPETPDQECLSQEELLKQPVHIPHRPLKDPREIRLLDPACGSMHFGLYAFDLFETIYEEAWDTGSCPALQEAYACKDEFLKDVPRLIIEHNIHGIDIDPRATQIAALSLWLRAQKAWQQQKVPAADRPRVRRSNIVCAEPMPGSPEMLKEFVATLNPPLLGELLKTVFVKMQLAGEAGSLLKIEEEIRTAIDTARKEWLKQQDDLLTRKGGSQEEFFDTAEQQVIDALRAYAEQADADSYQRRLFADDAARGFAFIDLCRKRYDAVVMNPPFGDTTGSCYKDLKSQYPESTGNIYPMFVKRGVEFSPLGSTGAITAKTFLALTSFKAYRRSLLSENQHLVSLVDLGWEVLDQAQVETCCFVIRGGDELPKILFIDLLDLDVNVKETQLLTEVRALKNADDSTRRFDVPIRSIINIPQQSFSYRLTPQMLIQYDRELTADGRLYSVFEGAAMSGAERYIHLWHEVAAETLSNHWLPLAHGGNYCPYYRPIVTVVDWENDGYRPKTEITSRYPYLNGSYGFKIKHEDRYHHPGLSYGKRTDALNVSVMPRGCIFSHEAQAIFPANLSEDWLLCLGLLNSRAIRYCANQIAGVHKLAPYVSRLPYSEVFRTILQPHYAGIQANVELMQRVARLCETNREFVLPLLLTARSTSLKDSFRDFIQKRVEEEEGAINSENAINQALEFELAPGDTIELVKREMGPLPGEPSERKKPPYSKNISSALADDLRAPYYLHRISRSLDCSLSDAKKLLSESDISDSPLLVEECGLLAAFLLGSSLGRWDIRYATGERQPPALLDPFDPLPVCPPGMLQNAEGLPMEKDEGSRMKAEGKYPLRVSWSGILVDDANHPEDIVARVREAIEVIWKDRAEAIEQEACGILGVKTLRDYFRRPATFFADHLKRYSKSRRQAPIYWPLSTKSGSYTLWLYYHRLTDQTLHTCLADFLDPKIRKIQAELDAAHADGSTRAAELREFLDELKDLHDEIERVIKLPWKPNLNDGVLITASPLWKLFRLPKWQKDLKACWDKLAKGDYDWAHLAYTIRPREVEKACEKDRAIAIAHDLEHLCRIETPKPKKKRGKTTTEEEEPDEDESELIEED
jgi:hypothetical protein